MRFLAVMLALAATTAPLLAQHQECAPTTIPATLPPPHEIIDSAAAISELRAANRLADHMLFSLVFTGDDSMPEVSPLEGGDVEAALVLLRSVWPEKPSGMWALRVAIAGDSGSRSASLALERSIYCPPVPERTSSLPRRIRFEARPGDHRPAPGTARVTIKFESWIDEAGNVTSVRVTQSSGFAELDNQLAQDWQTRKFKPALIDGRPIKALYRTDRGSPKL